MFEIKKLEDGTLEYHLSGVLTPYDDAPLSSTGKSHVCTVQGSQSADCDGFSYWMRGVSILGNPIVSRAERKAAKAAKAAKVIEPTTETVTVMVPDGVSFDSLLSDLLAKREVIPPVKVLAHVVRMCGIPDSQIQGIAATAAAEIAKGTLTTEGFCKRMSMFSGFPVAKTVALLADAMLK